jgi:Neuraminidase (sialidase)
MRARGFAGSRTYRAIDAFPGAHDMNTSKVAFAVAAFAIAALAHAAAVGDSAAGNRDAELTSPLTAVTLAPMARTRTEVRHELAQARQSGELDALRRVYSGH